MSKNTKTYAATLYEGTFSVGLDGKFVRIDREDPPEKGALKLSLNPFLIHTSKRIYLFDCGIGEFGEDTDLETMYKNLEAHGLTEFDINDIFLSHLHYDHIGGLAHRENGYWELTFPDAKIWVSKKGWEKVTAKEEYYDAEKTEFISFINAKADLHFLEEEDQPYPDIKVRKIGGHTEFHQVLLFDDGEKKYLQAGDVIGTKGVINRKYAAKFDFEPKVSQQRREELTKLAFEEGYTILPITKTETRYLNSQITTKKLDIAPKILNHMSLPDYITDIKNFLTEHGVPTQINAAVILGSGLGGFGDEIENPEIIPYSDIPLSAINRRGSLRLAHFGEVEGKTVLAFAGRFHHYEGHTFAKTVLPVQLAHAFGVEKLIISNAAGGINLRFQVGDLMIIDNIIKQYTMVSEPALNTWDSSFEEYAQEVKQIARDHGIETQMGTYLFAKGPSYESKAEIRAFRKMGGDAVGMSTAPELIEAARLGVKSAAISLITNAAAGVTAQKLDHDEVKEAADQKKDVFARLVKGLIREF